MKDEAFLRSMRIEPCEFPATAAPETPTAPPDGMSFIGVQVDQDGAHMSVADFNCLMNANHEMRAALEHVKAGARKWRDSAIVATGAFIITTVAMFLFLAWRSR